MSNIYLLEIVLFVNFCLNFVILNEYGKFEDSFYLFLHKYHCYFYEYCIV